MPREDAPDPRVRTRHGQLSLEEIADALPGTGDVMVHVADAWWRCTYAARGGNWELADYYARRTRSLQRTLAVIRPKHRERLETFERDCIDPLIEAIHREDLGAFDAAFATGTEMANRYHVETGHPYIEWSLPDVPPAGLRLTKD